jgi:hypothetical protein
MLLSFLASPTMAEPVTYVFSAVFPSPGGPGCDTDPNNPYGPFTGTITMDFANENPKQSSGNVGSPKGWTSVASGIDIYVQSVPYVFTMTVCGYGPYLNLGFFGSSSVTVGPSGINGQFELGDGNGQEGHIKFTNPSGHISANGLPLFDSPGTGSGLVGGGTSGIDFIVTSMTLVPPTVTHQLDGLVTESPGILEESANNAQGHVEAACTSLEKFVIQVNGDERSKKITKQLANQLIFDATTAELEIGC